MTAVSNLGCTRGARLRSRPRVAWLMALVAVAGMVAGCAAPRGTGEPATTAQLVVAGQVRLTDLGTGGDVSGWSVAVEPETTACDDRTTAGADVGGDLEENAVSALFVRDKGGEVPRISVGARTTVYVYASQGSAQDAYGRLASPAAFSDCQGYAPDEAVVDEVTVLTGSPAFGVDSSTLVANAELKGSDDTDHREFTVVRVGRAVVVVTFIVYGSYLEGFAWNDAQHQTVTNVVDNLRAAASVDPDDAQYAPVVPPTPTPTAVAKPTPGTSMTDDPRGLATAATLSAESLATDATSVQWFQDEKTPYSRCDYLTGSVSTLGTALVAERHSTAWRNYDYDTPVYANPSVVASTVAYVYPDAEAAAGAASGIDEATFVTCSTTAYSSADTEEADLDASLPVGATLQTYRSTEKPNARGRFGLVDRSVLVVGEVVVVFIFDYLGTDYTVDQPDGAAKVTIERVAADIAAVP